MENEIEKFKPSKAQINSVFKFYLAPKLFLSLRESLLNDEIKTKYYSKYTEDKKNVQIDFSKWLKEHHELVLSNWDLLQISILLSNEYKLHHVNGVSQVFIDDLYDRLLQALFQVLYFEEGIKKTNLFIDNFDFIYQHIDPSCVFKIVLDSVINSDGYISLDHEFLYSETHSYYHNTFIFLSKRQKKHKRYILSRYQNLKNYISKVKTGIPYKTYYPFFKKDYVKFLDEQISTSDYVFTLKIKEANKIADKLVVLFKLDIKERKKFKQSFKYFLCNNFEYPFDLTVFRNGIKSKTKIFLYLVYYLVKMKKCSLENFKLLISERPRLIPMSKQRINNQFKSFDHKSKPKTGTYLIEKVISTL